MTHYQGSEEMADQTVTNALWTIAADQMSTRHDPPMSADLYLHMRGIRTLNEQNNYIFGERE